MIDSGRIGHVDAIYTDWVAGAAQVKRQQLFPVDLPVTSADSQIAPLMSLPAAQLIATLGDDYFHARICNIALHAYAAENEARMAAMAAARSQIERELSENQALERRVRQEAITAEIIELATGNWPDGRTASAETAVPVTVPKPKFAFLSKIHFLRHRRFTPDYHNGYDVPPICSIIQNCNFSLM